MRTINRYILNRVIGVALAATAYSAVAYAQSTPQSTATGEQITPAATAQKPASNDLTLQGTVTAPTAEDAADVYFAQGRYQAAIAAYKQVDPPTATAWNKMGMSYQKMYNLEDAKKCYDAALKLSPKNVSIINNLATVYSGLKLYGSAEKAYRRALKIEPEDALINKNLGTLYMVQGKFNKGKHYFDEARRIDPKIFSTKGAMSVDEPTDVHSRGAMNYFMARSCLQSGQTDCAITYLRAAMNQGYTTAKKLATDPEFERLRGVYAFQQMLAEQNAKATQTPAK